MKIDVYWSWELPQKLPDLCLVTDVYAATGNMAFLLTHAKRRLFLVNKQTVVKIKRQNPDATVIGESEILPDSYFAAPNTPSHLASFNFPDQDLYYMSINGTKVIEKVFKKGAKEIIALSFLNINKVANWLNIKHPQEISIIPAGQLTYGDPKNPEDVACAQTLKTILEGNQINWKNYLATLNIKFRQYYSREDQNQINLDSEIIFNVDSLPIIPVCQLIKPGLIEVVKG